MCYKTLANKIKKKKQRDTSLSFLILSKKDTKQSRITTYAKKNKKPKQKKGKKRKKSKPKIRSLLSILLLLLFKKPCIPGEGGTVDTGDCVLTVGGLFADGVKS